MFTYGLDGANVDFEKLPFQPQTPVSGRRHKSLAATGIPGTAGSPHYGTFTPIKFSADTTITKIGLRVIFSFTGTTQNYRLGIYADDNGHPGARLLDAGTLAISNPTSPGHVDITLGTPLSVSANTVYWLAVGSANLSGTPALQIDVGYIEPFASLGTLGELGACGYYFNHNGANALPDPAPSTTSPTYGAPTVWVTVS